MKTWPKDRNGNYFLTGCRVKDIYSDKYGELKGYTIQNIYPRMLIAFDGEKADTVCAPVFLEVISGGLQPGTHNK